MDAQYIFTSQACTVAHPCNIIIIFSIIYSTSYLFIPSSSRWTRTETEQHISFHNVTKEKLWFHMDVCPQKLQVRLASLSTVGA